MSNTRMNIDNIRDEIAKLEGANERIGLQVEDLAARREDAEGERRRNAARLTQLRSDLREILDKPETERRALVAIASLRARLAAAPVYAGDHRSPTRQRIGYDLDAIEANDRLSPADRLARVEALSRDFADRRGLDLMVYANSERR